jgi:hypothetical protein
MDQPFSDQLFLGHWVLKQAQQRKGNQNKTDAPTGRRKNAKVRFSPFKQTILQLQGLDGEGCRQALKKIPDRRDFFDPTGYAKNSLLVPWSRRLFSGSVDAIPQRRRQQEETMGLDCYWSKPNNSKSKPLDFDPPLCFEDELDEEQRREGWAVFAGARGFERAIEEITGISLRVSTTWRYRLFPWRGIYRFTSCLTTRTVLKIAARLERFGKEPWTLPPSKHRRGHHYWDAEVYRDIARMFRAYGEAGYELHGDW